MHRFYVAVDFEIGNNYQLPDEVVRHINVLRVRTTETIELFNGDGFNYCAEFIQLEKRSVEVYIKNKSLANNESSLKIILLMSVIANDKFDLVVQKAVELGVYKIVPIITQHTQRNFTKDKLSAKMNHWQKIIVSASEQCYRAKLMQIVDPIEINDAINSMKDIEHKYICSPHHVGNIENSVKNVDEIILCVGPEGGFTLDEVEYANGFGFKSILLGKRIMRAETAALSAVSVFQKLFGDF